MTLAIFRRIPENGFSTRPNLKSSLLTMASGQYIRKRRPAVAFSDVVEEEDIDAMLSDLEMHRLRQEAELKASADAQTRAAVAKFNAEVVEEKIRAFYRRQQGSKMRRIDQAEQEPCVFCGRGRPYASNRVVSTSASGFQQFFCQERCGFMHDCSFNSLPRKVFVSRGLASACVACKDSYV